MSKRLCSIEGCEKLCQARSYCYAHYNQWRRTGDPIPKIIYQSGCNVEGCNNKHSGLGYCGFHYQRIKKGIPFDRPKHAHALNDHRPTCSVDGCEREHTALSYCATHWQRYKRGQDMETPIRSDKIWEKCIVEGCERTMKTKNLCSKHHAYWLRKGVLPGDIDYNPT